MKYIKVSLTSYLLATAASLSAGLPSYKVADSNVPVSEHGEMTRMLVKSEEFVYDMTGARYPASNFSKLRKGLYIFNGKKIII